jgi:CP family cyanate transporter-like MFS transporter
MRASRYASASMMANPGLHRLVTLVLLWLAGLYLRLPILVAPPLAPLVGAELDLSQSQIGALTTVPVLMLALGALPGSFVVARLGARRTAALALVVLAAASAARGLAPPATVLFGATALLGLAVAVMQPAMPALVARWCPGFLALGSAVYMNGMLMGEFIGGGLTLPWVMPLVAGDWRAALVVWSLPAVAVAALVVAGRRLEGPVGNGRSMVAPAWNPRWRDPRVWQLGVLLGAASAGFFGTNAYLGPILEAIGQPERLPAALFWFNLTQVAGSLAMVWLGSRLVGRRGPVLAVAAAVLLGLVGVGLGHPSLMLPAALLLGFATCIQLILMVSLVPQITVEEDTAPLAAGMFAIGYLLGFVVPLAGGLVADATGAARTALLPMMVLALLALAVAARPAFGQGWRLQPER